MTHDAAQDRALLRLRSWRPRRPVEPPPAFAPAPVPQVAVSPDSRVPEISALLADLDTLRLGLSTDLGMAASAVEAGAYDVARDVVDGGRHDLASFVARAERHLSRPAAGDAVPAVGMPPTPRRQARRLAVLGPALTAAAAVVGLLTGVVPDGSGSAGPRPSLMSEAAASYAELWRLHEQGAPASRLREVARQLHAEVGRIVGVAAADPATAEQALRLLELEVRVLGHPQHGGALDAELAESQRLVSVLRRAAARVDEAVASLPQPEDLPPATAPDAAGAGAPEPDSAPDVRRDTTSSPPAPAAAADAGPATAPTTGSATSSPETGPAAGPEPEPTGSPASHPPGSWFPTHAPSSVLPD